MACDGVSTHIFIFNCQSLFDYFESVWIKFQSKQKVLSIYGNDLLHEGTGWQADMIDCYVHLSHLLSMTFVIPTFIVNFRSPIFGAGYDTISANICGLPVVVGKMSDIVALLVVDIHHPILNLRKNCLIHVFSPLVFLLCNTLFLPHLAQLMRPTSSNAHLLANFCKG